LAFLEIELKGDDFAKLKPVGFNLVTHVRQSSIFEEPRQTKVKRMLRLCARVIKRVMPGPYNVIKPLFGIYPHFVKMKCIFCGNCIEICPAKALVIIPRKKLWINKNRCIRCFCCHEICPKGAIVMKMGI
jgi:ferredoxin